MNDRNGVPVKVGARVKVALGDLPSFEGWVRTIRYDDMFARVDNGEQNVDLAEGSFVAFARADEIEVLP